jgi:hypothetical protein
MKYGITVGSGEFADMALCQLRSLAEFTNASQQDIIANCPPDEWTDIPVSTRGEIETLATVTHAKPPLAQYAPSACLATANQCNKQVAEDEWFVLLDTDILILDDLAGVPVTGTSLIMKPGDFRPERVGLSESTIRRSFEIVGVPFPGTTHRSTIDNKPIPPYWNAGVVLIKDSDIIDKWIEYTERLYQEFPDLFFLDQLSLSAVSAKFEAMELSEQYNFVVSQHLWTPSETAVLHYHSPIELRWVMNPLIYSRLRRIGVYNLLELGSTPRQLKQLAIRFARLRLRF